MPVLINQIPAAFLAVFVVVGVWGGALAIQERLKSITGTSARLDSIGWFYVLVFVMSTALAARTWARTPAVEWIILALIMAGNVHLLRGRLPYVKKEPFLQLGLSKYILGFLLIGLSMDFLLASLPFYRYDQWTYHLVLAKWISKMGSLTLPITYDPIFFTGSYEFLGLLARAVSDSDIFQQGFQNSLSWLLVALPAATLFSSTLSPSNLRLTGALAFAGLCIFGPSDHEAVINSKPDYVLMMTALILIIFSSQGSAFLSPMLAGFLLVAGASFKLTWIHFALCAPVIIYGALGKNILRKSPAVLLGGLAAIPCLIPWLLKNWQFFGNPFHPIQTTFFQSSMWDSRYVDFWAKVAQKPENIGGFLGNFILAIASIPFRWTLTEAVILVLVGMVWWAEKAQKNELPSYEDETHQSRTGIVLFCFFIYLFTWGLFYSSSVFNRFVAPGFAFFLFLVWMLCENLSRLRKFNSQAIIILIVPFIFNSQLEVTARDLLRATTHSWPSLAEDATGPLGKVPDLLALAAHRKHQFPDASYTEATLLSDFGYSYYNASAFWIGEDPALWWNMQAAGVDPVDGDGFLFLRKMDIRYVWIVDPEIFKKAPPAIQKIIGRLELIPSRIGKLYFVSSP